MKSVPKKLREALAQGLVVPFVGAGVSMAVMRPGGSERLFPSWSELLLHAAERLEEENRPQHQLVRGFLTQHVPDYLQAAKYAYEGLASLWPDFFRHELDPLHAEADDATLELARLIWDLGSNLVITTNYDRVLRWVSGSDTDTVPTANSARLLAMQRRDMRRRTIWHLHGSIDDPSQVILTPEGYQRLYLGTSEKQYRGALDTLRHLMASRHLLFVGFSLDDEHLVDLLRDVSEAFGSYGGPHYVVARTRDIGQIRQKISKIDVDFIEFEDFGSPLEDCIRSLSALCHLEVAETQSNPRTTKRETNKPRRGDTGAPPETAKNWAGRLLRPRGTTSRSSPRSPRSRVSRRTLWLAS